MSRSYLSKQGTYSRNFKKIYVRANFRSFVTEYNRIEGDANEKRFVKKKAKILRKAKKDLNEHDYNTLCNELRQGKYLIPEIRIQREESEHAVFSVSDEDVIWLLNQFSSLDLLPVKSILFKLFDTNKSFSELLSGIETTTYYGRYEMFSNKITINGLRISNQNHPFIKHILFYYKVVFLSVIAHEIFHNIDLNSTRYRIGQKNDNKIKGDEAFANSMHSGFYKNHIIPYILEIYNDDYRSFINWMETKGVLPLEAEFWKLSIPNKYFDDGMNDLFIGIDKNESPLRLNLLLVKKMIWPECFDKSLEYCNYILSEISPDDYETKRLKALVLTKMSDYTAAEVIFTSIYETGRKEPDNELISHFAYTKYKLRKFDEAYDLYKNLEPIDSSDIIHFAHCLVKLNKKDELDKLIQSLTMNSYFQPETNESQNKANFYLMSIYVILKDYKKSIQCFKKLNINELHTGILLWSKFLALKTYLVLKEFGKAKLIIKSIEKQRDLFDDYFHLVKRIMRFKKRLK